MTPRRKRLFVVLGILGGVAASVSLAVMASRENIMFYYDPSHRYITGLDPTYLYDKDPALSQLYDRITLGKEEDPGPLIRDRFGSHYVFTDNSHGDFFDNAQASGWFEIVYEDRDCTILQIRDQKLEPQPEESDKDNTGNEEPQPEKIP